MNNARFGLENVTAVLGTQWGDEGKGKLVDILSKEFDLIARATGGANAGHTIVIPNPLNSAETTKFIFHLIPSGIIHENKIAVIGNGVVIHIPTFMEEMETLKKYNIDISSRLLISDRAHIVFDYHKKIDAIEEEQKGTAKVGTTLRGIGPAYQDKIARRGVRMGEILDFENFSELVRRSFNQLKNLYTALDHDIEEELKQLKVFIEVLKPFITDTALYLNKSIDEGKTVLIEGANGLHLDIDHGTYPFVTSSNASVGGIITGTGIGLGKVKSVVGIMKAYVTRVGSGVFPTELLDETGNALREKGGEYGSTTGRPRRCGWFDAVVGRYAVMINGLTSINLTKLDVLDDMETIKICDGYKYKGKKLESMPAAVEMYKDLELDYIEMPGWKTDTSKALTFEELPENAQKYVLKLEELIKCPINFIGVGVRRDQIIHR